MKWTPFIHFNRFIMRNQYSVIIFTIIFSFQLMSCINSDQTNLNGGKLSSSSNLAKYNIEKLIKLENLNISSVLLDYKLISLDSRQNVGEVHRIVVNSKFIAVFDRSVTNNVFVYDHAGQLVWYSKNRGSGPLELAEIADVKFTQDDQLMILDSSLKKLMQIKLPTGEIIDSYHIPTFGYQFAPLLNHQILLFTWKNIIPEIGRYNAVSFDLKTEKPVKGYFPFRDGEEKSDFLNLGILSGNLHTDTYFFTRPFDSRIYAVDSHGKEYITLDLSQVVSPPTVPPFDKLDADQITKLIYSQQNRGAVSNPVETDSFILLHLNNEAKEDLAFFNKSNQTFYWIEKLIFDSFGNCLTPICLASDGSGRLYFSLDPAVIQEVINVRSMRMNRSPEEITSELLAQAPALAPVIKNLSAASNPVIVQLTLDITKLDKLD